MTDRSDEPGSFPEPAPDDVDRDAILARRKRFIAAAIVGMASAASTPACSEPRVCLDFAFDAGPSDGGPDGSGADAGGSDAGGADAGGADGGDVDAG